MVMGGCGSQMHESTLNFAHWHTQYGMKLCNWVVYFGEVVKTQFFSKPVRFTSMCALCYCM